MRIKIKNQEIIKLVSGEEVSFPKYSTQIMNLANRNAQGTRPAMVGQMSELIQEFTGKNLKEWEKWYINEKPGAIDAATEKVYEMVIKLREVTDKIDKKLVKKWVKDLLVLKTFTGLKFQEAILKRVAEILKENYTLATKQEESKGIDGYIGNKPVSIKPNSYKRQAALSENIDYEIIYYEKKKDGIVVEFDL